MSSRSTSSVSRRIAIVGGGIVGACLAAELAERGLRDVTVIEQGPEDRLIGSTGHAPGFVGLFNEVPVLTRLARASAARYRDLKHQGVEGFTRSGGLEVATTAAGLSELERRAALAAIQGLPVQQLNVADIVARSPELIDPNTCVGGTFYPDDGTAHADVLNKALVVRARALGVTFLYDSKVTAIDTQGGRVIGVAIGDRHLVAEDVVIACGIWGPGVVAGLDHALRHHDLPLTPVAHPYVYGPQRASRPPSSFVRWPDQHVYARDHGGCIGLGSYDHAPVSVAVGAIGGSAERPWLSDEFDPTIGRAIDLLPASSRFQPAARLNGLFSMTADNLPLVGRYRLDGLWLAEAVWVTHAGGVAQALADIMTGVPASIEGIAALQPDRFDGQEPAHLEREALRLYRDIYASAPGATPA
jgi:glycine/D-amino acid oxidase-like deaminating enzyme